MKELWVEKHRPISSSDYVLRLDAQKNSVPTR